MKLNDFLSALEAIAPQALALEWDNVGLLIGPDHDEVRHVLVALDCTPVTAQEALECAADLLLTHHPLFLSGIKRFLPNDPETAGAYILARHGIGHVAAHTNLDVAQGGVNDALAAALGLTGTAAYGAAGMGRIGTLPTPVSLERLAQTVAAQLDTAVRVCGAGTRLVSRVAVLGGAGSGEAEEAVAAGAEVYITGECRHHHALYAAQRELCVIEAGHYETERVALPLLIKCLQERTPGVQYQLTRSEKPSLRKL